MLEAQSKHSSRGLSRFVLPPISQILFCVMSTTSYAELNQNLFQINVMSEFLAAGGLNLEDDVLMGIEGMVYFSGNANRRYFLSGGFRTDLDNEGSTLDILSADVGAQFGLGTLFEKPLYLESSLGVNYIRSEYATQLIERQAVNGFDSLGFKASLGLGLNIHENLGTKLYINQFGGDGTTLGLGFSYSF